MTSLEQAIHQAIALHQAGKLDAAQSAYDAILRQHPRDPNALMNLSTLLNQRGQYEEAARVLKRLINFHPKLPQPHFGYANVLQKLGKLEEAIVSFERHLTLDPHNANAHWNLATAYLLLGNYEKGLPHFEWRFRSDHLKAHARTFDTPQWEGQAPQGKTVLIHSEQGFGDFIQSARYFPLLAARGANLVIETPPALLRVMQASFPSLTLIPTGAPLPPHDFHCPIMSLPLAFQITLDTIPNQVPYLTVPHELLQQWQARLGPKTRTRIGLVWAGAAHHLNDKNRSIPSEMLQPLLQLPFEFHSLQKEERAGDIASLPTLMRHGDALQDFADTAALVSQMDLVISVDTSVAHLAGALGVPTWLLLPTPPDYRWLLARTDSPLYPSMRLFRRPSGDEWSAVIDKVREALHTHA